MAERKGRTRFAGSNRQVRATMLSLNRWAGNRLSIDPSNNKSGFMESGVVALFGSHAFGNLWETDSGGECLQSYDEATPVS